MNNYWRTLRAQRLRRRRLLQMAALGSAGLGAVALVGCGDDSEPSASTGSTTPDTSPTAAAGASSSGQELAESQVVRRRHTQDIIPFDPATIFRVNTEDIAFSVYSALVTYDAAGQIVPDVAEGWENPDPTTYVFHLNQGVQWHGGYGELTTEDVLYSYERIMDPATGSTYILNFGLIDQISAPDAYTLTFNLKEPDANFLHQVSNYHQGAIINQEAFETLGDDYGYNPIGTGPFVFASYVPDQEVVLDRFADYFRGPATLERVHLPRISNAETAAIAFQNQEIDILGSVSNEQTFRQLESDDRIAITISEATTGVRNLLVNGSEPPLNDARVRKAMTHAIDREALVGAIVPLTGEPWHNIIPGWMDVFNREVPQYNYDPEAAMQLLSAAGYPDGFSARWLEPSASDELVLVLDYWSRIGVNVEFELVDEPTFVSRRVSGDFEITHRGLPAANPDDVLFGYLHSDFMPPNGYNVAFYSNPEVDRLLEEARSEFDFETRRSLYFEAQALAMNDAPYLPLRATRGMEIAFNWIGNLASNPIGNMIYYDMMVLRH